MESDRTLLFLDAEHLVSNECGDVLGEESCQAQGCVAGLVAGLEDRFDRHLVASGNSTCLESATEVFGNSWRSDEHDMTHFPPFCVPL
jgi:hypothetical protein